MALSHRDVAIAAVLAFVSWGFLTHWVPVLRYLGYAFVTGAAISGFAILFVNIVTVKRRTNGAPSALQAPCTIAVIEQEAWEAETAWLATKAGYKRKPLFPSSFVVSDSLDGLLEWVIRDFVTSWYGNITRRPNFPNEIDDALRVVLLGIKSRLEAHDMVEVMVSRFVPIVTSHLKDFYDAEHAVRGKKLNRNVTESEELDLAIAAKYKDGKLHPAASLAFSDTKMAQQEYMRKLVVRLMPEVLSESMIRSRAVSVLIKEVVSCGVLTPVMQILSDPDTWNQSMEAYGRTMLQDRKTVQKLRAALDEHASPAPKISKVHSFPKLSPYDDERRFERFIRAMRQCNNLSDARRFRSEVASQLKRESMLPGQDHIYLRRLETGKRILDQRVAKLSAVGGSSNSGLAQSDFSNGRVFSRTTDASLQEVLHNASGLSYFMEYMDRQRLMTLVQFWVVVDGFRNPLEDDMLEGVTTTDTQWTESDRQDIAQIAEAYLSKPELKVPEISREAVRSFLKAGQNATLNHYAQARSVILRIQSMVLEEMQEIHFRNFQKSDLYYKYLTSDDSSTKAARQDVSKAPKSPYDLSKSELPAISPAQPLQAPRLVGPTFDLRRNATSSSDLRSPVKASTDNTSQSLRRSFDISPSAPLFDEDIEPETLAQSTHSLDAESLNDDHSNDNQAQVVQAMEAALNNIMTDGSQEDDRRDSLLDPHEQDSIFREGSHSPHVLPELKSLDIPLSEKERERPNLASLGLVNTSSRIGVFHDDDLFGDEEKFNEDEHSDPEEFVEDKELQDEIHEAAPGDLGLAEAISTLTIDIERLVAQESVVDTLTRKAELTNNVAELRILGKSKASLQREIRRKELQRQQYIVQESDNSLYGRASVDIKSIMVGKEPDGQEFALYVIEVQRKAGEHMSAASWAVARRYSEFHELHQRLRNVYPTVRNLDFPRRRLVLKLQREFLHKRRVSLENYLRELLRLPAVCRSRDLRAFLSQQAIISTHKLGRDSERRDIVSRIYNSVTDGMDEFLGNITVLDQLSIAGQNLISAATSQYNNLPSTVVNDSQVTVSTAEAQAELEAFENRELEPFVKPICDIFLETFELNRGQNWLRGRAVVVVLHQLLGGTVERKVRENLKFLLSDLNLLKYIRIVKDSMWPNGNLQRDRKPRTEGEKAISRREASVMLATLIPDLAGNVVGRANAQAASRRIFATANNARLNTHLAFRLLDEAVAVLFPDAGPRARRV
ncbi:Intermediate filament protein [Xylographa opegraphella]|nr:Intermediate filament protein [Xylographa opegraphella]